MATVTRENIGLLTDKITVNVSKGDYLPSFEKSLKQYGKQANIPGFRKGMVPAGLIKKMYGNSVFTDEVLRTVEKELTTYMSNEKLEIFAQPLPLPDNDSRQIDINNPADYSFAFEIGLKPAFALADLGSARLTRLKVDVTPAMIDEEVERQRTRNGKMAETKRERSRYINEFIKPLKDKLDKAGGFDFDIYGRPKSIHSIWNKMRKKGVAFEEVYDLFAIRVILNSPPEKEKEDCWKVYSMITDEYNPSPERLRDWLSNPKSNGYEALHTTVMGPQGKWVEVQIRSKRMNEIAEKGLAAHWKYKEGAADESRFDKWFQQIREVLNNQDNDSIDFLQDFKTSFLAEEIYVYTPKGDVKMLPVGSTALDFAFSIHSAIGVQCIGAKVNHKLVPISHKLRSGDQVEIITSGKQKPNEDWLGIVVTAKAKSKIKDALKEEKRKIADEGKYIVQRRLENFGAAYNQHNIDILTAFYKLSSSLDFFYQVSVRNIDLKELKEFQVLGDRLEPPKPAKPVDQRPADTAAPAVPRKDTELIIFGESSDRIVYTLANCCKPIPGDDVFGFVSIGKGLTIHRTNCPNAAKLMANYGHRVVKTKWAKNKEISFLTGIRIVGMDDVGVINKITNLISGELKLNIAALTIEAKDGLFEGNIRIYVHDKEELDELVIRLKQLNGINTVVRYDTETAS